LQEQHGAQLEVRLVEVWSMEDMVRPSSTWRKATALRAARRLGPFL